MNVALIGGLGLLLVALVLLALRAARHSAPGAGATDRHAAPSSPAVPDRNVRVPSPPRAQGGASTGAPPPSARTTVPPAQVRPQQVRAPSIPRAADLAPGAQKVPSIPVVLIVDDSPVMRRTLISLFGKAGYQTAGASDGAAALSWVRGNGMPGLVTLDMEMPGMDGLQTLDALQALGLDRPVRAVFVTNKMEGERARASATQKGAIGFFSKPYDPAGLLALAQRVAPLA